MLRDRPLAGNGPVEPFEGVGTGTMGRRGRMGDRAATRGPVRSCAAAEARRAIDRRPVRNQLLSRSQERARSFTIARGRAGGGAPRPRRGRGPRSGRLPSGSNRSLRQGESDRDARADLNQATGPGRYRRCRRLGDGAARRIPIGRTRRPSIGAERAIRSKGGSPSALPRGTARPAPALGSCRSAGYSRRSPPRRRHPCPAERAAALGSALEARGRSGTGWRFRRRAAPVTRGAETW